MTAVEDAFRHKGSGGYSLAMRRDGRGQWGLLVLVRRAVRWRARSHRQIWATTVAAYLVSVSAVLLTEGWPRPGGFWFVTAAATCIGVGVLQSFDLRRHRNEEPR
jgi:hypothetical protein